MAPTNEMDSLTNQMKSLKVTELLRKSKRMPLPSAELVTEFESLAVELSNRKMGGSAKIRLRRTKGMYGVPPIVMAKCWELLVAENPLPSKAKKHHFLWLLNYLKEYRIESNASGSFKTDEKTYWKWVVYFLSEISNLVPEVIRWENRKVNDRGADCLVSVDGTDIRFQQIRIDNPNKPGKKMINKALYSKKFNGPALRYEVAICLLSSDIVNIEGPFCPGDYNDISIFRQSLKHMLEPGERAEADDGYIGDSPEFIKCPGSFTNDEERLPIQRRIAGRHELINKRIKHFSCLIQPFKGRDNLTEKIQKHSQIFRSCCVLTQIGLEMGVGELWDIDDSADVDDYE